MKDLRQSGVTLVELLVALGVSGILLGAAAKAWNVVYTTQTGATALIQAAVSLESAYYWMRTDGQMAQTASAGGATLSFTWGEGAHTSAYALSGTDLQRTFNGVATTVARNVYSYSVTSQGHLVTMDITVAPPGGSSQQSRFYVTLRPTAQ